MRFIGSLEEGMHVHGIYLCKTKNAAMTKNGKEYYNLTLQDRTGQIDAKIWDPNSMGIAEFDPMDFISIDGSVTTFNGGKQLNISMAFRAQEGSYDPANYFPATSKNIDEMKAALAAYVDSVQNEHLSGLLRSFFDDEEFVKRFAAHSAAKSVHHGFIGGLLEHSLSVAGICSDMAAHYPFANRDLLVTGALLHDIGKLKELSPFPGNDYTDAGQLLGHIVIGTQWVSEHIAEIGGFPPRLANEILHLIVSHHGDLEYGSPKKPALIEAMILSFADNMDAKVETMYEMIQSKEPQNEDGWLGYNKLLDTNVRKSGD